MKKIVLASILSLLFISISCEKKENDLKIEPTTNDEINYFIWKGLNLYYLWQKDVPTLADNRFSNFDELYSFFRRYDSPEDTFNSLLNQPGNIDRFS